MQSVDEGAELVGRAWCPHVMCECVQVAVENALNCCKRGFVGDASGLASEPCRSEESSVVLDEFGCFFVGPDLVAVGLDLNG